MNVGDLYIVKLWEDNWLMEGCGSSLALEYFGCIVKTIVVFIIVGIRGDMELTWCRVLCHNKFWSVCFTLQLWEFYIFAAATIIVLIYIILSNIFKKS